MGLRDTMQGNAKEIEGKATNDKSKEMEGKLQKIVGDLKDKANEMADDLKKKKS